MNDKEEEEFELSVRNIKEEPPNLEKALKNDEKLFLGYWGDGYEKPATVCYMTEDDFTKDMGYNEKEIERIKNLKHGETAAIGPHGAHLVTRVV